MNELIKTGNGVELINTGGSMKQGGFWAAGLGGLILGYLGGNVLGGSRASAFGHNYGRAGRVEFENGVSRFDLDQSEKINLLQIEVSKRDAIIGDVGAVKESAGYTDKKIAEEISELRRWANDKFITQPTVSVTVSGATIGTVPAAA